jgi:hypothetical protein
MQSEFNREKRDRIDLDRSVREAWKERPGKPIKLRIQPMVLRSVDGKGGQYHAWKDVRWMLTCDSPAEAYAMREALRAFFDTVGRVGAAEAQRALQAAQTTPASGESGGESAAGAA